MSRSFLTSDRLLYEPLDVQSEQCKKLFYKIMDGDQEARAQLTSCVLSPTPRSASEEDFQSMKSNLFNAVVCLKPSNWAEIRNAPSDGSLRGVPIGIICLTGMPANNAHRQSAQMAISMLAEHQGKGYGTEAVRFLLDWAFLFANLNCVRLRTLDNNVASQRVYEKAGFVHEGRLRQNNYWDGKWHDTILMSVLRDEWQARRDAGEQAEQQA